MQYTHDVSDPPSVEHLLAFIERRKKFAPDHRLAVLKDERQQKQKTQANRKTLFQAQESLKSPEPNKAKCPCCGQQHNIFACSGFKTLFVQARIEKVRPRSYAITVLVVTIFQPIVEASVDVADASQRTTRSSARKWKLLPLQRKLQRVFIGYQFSSCSVRATRTSYRDLLASHSNGTCISWLLSTKVWAQLDTGAMISLVTSKLARSIKAKKFSGTSVLVTRVGRELYSTHAVELQLQSFHSTEKIIVRANVVDHLLPCVSPGNIPAARKLPKFKNLTLADPRYTPDSQVNILLGSREGTLFSTDRDFKAENTIFGWAVGGFTSASTAQQTTSICLKLAPVQENAEQLLQRYWALEEVPGDASSLSAEEQRAVSHFMETHSRDTEGRYNVSLPKRDPPILQGKLRETALKRYLGNQKSLKKNGKWDSFHQGLEEHLQMVHAAAELLRSSGDIFYQPAHGVVKESSTTTKLRIVYNSSARSSSGHSLNDVLLPGPSLYPLLSTIINHFRFTKLV